MQSTLRRCSFIRIVGSPRMKFFKLNYRASSIFDVRAAFNIDWYAIWVGEPSKRKMKAYK